MGYGTIYRYDSGLRVHIGPAYGQSRPALSDPAGCQWCLMVLSRSFLVIQAVLFGAQLTPWGQEYFVIPWTNGLAHFCAQLVALFDSNAETVGKILRSTSTGLRSVSGRL